LAALFVTFVILIIIVFFIRSAIEEKSSKLKYLGGLLEEIFYSIKTVK